MDLNKAIQTLEDLADTSVLSEQEAQALNRVLDAVVCDDRMDVCSDCGDEMHTDGESWYCDGCGHSGPVRVY